MRNNPYSPKTAPIAYRTFMDQDKLIPNCSANTNINANPTKKSPLINSPNGLYLFPPLEFEYSCPMFTVKIQLYKKNLQTYQHKYFKICYFFQSRRASSAAGHFPIPHRK